ncbi:MAG: ABC transporter permease subunit [Chloroflexi bacterium]|nr:ABC transporter permease subunit [Chloroflexota bacterium]
MAQAVEAKSPAVVGTRSAAVRRPFRRDLMLLYAILILVALFFIMPLVWMVSTALKFESAVFTDTDIALGFIPSEPTLENFTRILTASGNTPVFRWMLNSFLVSTIGTLLTLVLSSLSAYAFARIDFPLKNLLFAVLIGTLLLPGVLFLVPQFLIIDILGLFNTYPALILPGLAGVFGIFFMRQFFLGIPVELEEAAYVDGANRFRTFWSVVLPLAGPALATLAVISFLAYWNDYLWPLIVCQGEGGFGGHQGVTEPARASIDLDGEWRFVADPERLYDVADLPEGDAVTVPGCWEAQVPRPYRIITAWYHRRFDVPGDWSDGRLLLRFGAVMYRCAVWLNGQPIGGHEGGYTPFTLEAAHEVVRWGAENELAVEVENPLNAIAEYPAMAVERVLSAEQYAPDLPLSEAPHGKQTWYSSQSGLWKSVRAERVGAAHFRSIIVLPDVAGSHATARWRVEAMPDVGELELDLAVIGPAGEEVSRTRVTSTPDTRTGETALPIPNAVLWDLETPRLYHLHARLLMGANEEDGISERFGMREVGTAGGFITLNGRPIFVLGVLDQDLYPDTISTPPSRDFLREQVRRAKELGFNLLRCHIKVPDPSYLEVADEEGILLWCELPNWTRFTVEAAARGRATLDRMVETMGSHPSIVIWTIINEDWGTKLRYERRDREWLRGTYDWLKELDPTRLVTDNSACETTETPNFHLKSDLADFHVYFGPDNGVRWRSMMADFASHPAWLWSPHGDAQPRGDEPLILSEFGGWGLPRLDRLIGHHGHEPWWFGTGQGYYRPTQWHQFESLHYQITEMRRYASITGYVVTELTDAYWEANGMLDPMRGTKVYHERFAEINAPDVVAMIAARRDLWGGESLIGDVLVASVGAAGAPGGRVEWSVEMAGHPPIRGEMPLAAWPANGIAELGRLEVPLPAVERPTDAWLRLAALDGEGRRRAENRLRFAVLAAGAVADPRPSVAVHDPLDIWGVRRRVQSLGHRIVGRDEADVVITTQLTPELVAHAEAGGNVLVLVRSSSAVPAELDLRRRVGVHLRRLPHAGWPGQRSPWEGDWVSNFNWILPETFPRLPDRRLLDQAYEEVAPDHVLLGYDPVQHRDEVMAGMFVGWVHEPAALIWHFEQGRGSIVMTTFQLAPESGPVASTMLECLVDRFAERSLAERRHSLEQTTAR